MIIDAISDLHGHLPSLEGGDLLIVAGDLTANDKPRQYDILISWLHKQDYERIVVIAGNHDMMIQNDECLPLGDYQDNKIEYLCDSGTEFHNLKIWGSPWSLWFPEINPNFSAFTSDDYLLKEFYDLIPEDIDILITHTPPYGVLDINKNNDHCGSISLRNSMTRTNPKLHFFGHIHEMGGKEIDLTTTKCYNCSIMNENYEPKNKITRVIL